MKKIILVIFSAMGLSSSVFADAVNPPSGPYRSMVEINGVLASTSNKNNIGTNSSASDATGSNEFNSSISHDKTNESVAEKNKIDKNNPQSGPEWNKQRVNNYQAWQNQQSNQQAQQWGKQNYNQTEVPDWVKQRQHDMQKRMQQFHAQQQAQQQTQQGGWDKRQAWNRNQPVQREVLKTQPETAQKNQLQEYFPSARGQVYGPQNIAPSYYMQHAQPRQPVYQARRPMPQYSPRWK